MERAFQIEALEETRHLASKRLASHQAITKRHHDKKLRPVNIVTGDLVLLYDSRYMHFLGKLHTRWLGPFLVHQMYPNGSLQLITYAGDMFPNQVSYDRVKKYHHRDIPKV